MTEQSITDKVNLINEALDNISRLAPPHPRHWITRSKLVWRNAKTMDEIRRFGKGSNTVLVYADDRDRSFDLAEIDEHLDRLKAEVIELEMTFEHRAKMDRILAKARKHLTEDEIDFIISLGNVRAIG